MWGDRLEFVIASYNDPLPWKDETFNGMYHIQAFSYCRDLDFLLSEIYRVLKPGSKISFLDWFLLEKFDKGNPEHMRNLKEIK
jgi:sterol 24-C-methyltransferase